jgi:hypothetical protein
MSLAGVGAQLGLHHDGQDRGIGVRGGEYDHDVGPELGRSYVGQFTG